jgi:hypothetical protein
MDVPHPGRMHDYWLGGGHNFAADRELAEKIMQVFRGIEDVARLNQAFLRRAALFMIESGIRQFLDLGSGIPTIGNLHEIVQQANPECRVVYVDIDPVSIAHTELMLERVEDAAVIQADMRNVASILDADASRALLDLNEPMGVFAPNLHFIPDSWDPACIMAGYRDRIASGSYLAIMQLAVDEAIHELDDVVAAYRTTHYHLYPRTREAIMRLCAGYELVEPGLVGFGHWRPAGPGDTSLEERLNSVLCVAVGRKP